jgi:hypothetical protein
MRRSILSRSVVGIATLAIGSIALAATPATAATAGVSRDQVLTAVDGVRTSQSTQSQLSVPASKALRAIVNQGCDVSAADGDSVRLGDLFPTNAGDDADGLLMRVVVDNDFDNSSRNCTIAAFASTAPTFTLSGTATITGARYNPTIPPLGEYDPPSTLLSQQMSGDAFVTDAVDNTGVDAFSLSAAASGNAAKTTTTTTSVKVKDKKSRAEKKKARASYVKRIKTAKKSYATALDKAGSSKSRRAAAKTAYKARRAAAKAAFRYAVAGHRLVRKTTSTTENRPFSVTTVEQDTRP